MFGNSPFLTASILKDPAFAHRLMNAGSDDTFGEITDEGVEEIPSALKEDLVRVAGGASDQAANFARLKKTIRERADKVYALFRDLIESPAAALPTAETDSQKETTP